MGCLPSSPARSSSELGPAGERMSKGLRSLSVYATHSLHMPEQEQLIATVFVDETAALNGALPQVPVEQQGLSLRFLREFMDEFQLARKGIGNGDVTTGDVVERFVRPMTGRMRECTVVDMTKAGERGRITHFISHPWNNKFRHTASAALEACEEWETETGRTAFFWMDIFAVNQHRMARKEYTQADINDMLDRAVRSAEVTYACLYPWREPLYLARAWCLFEAHRSLQQRVEDAGATDAGATDAGATDSGADQGKEPAPTAAKGPVRRASEFGRPRSLHSSSANVKARRGTGAAHTHELRFILSPDAREEFENEALSAEFDAVLQALADINVRRAQSFKAEDKGMILRRIEAAPGGAAALNQSVAQSLREWLVRSGRGIVARRRRTHMNTPKLAQILVNFGRLLGDQAQTRAERSEAEALFREALSIDRSALRLHAQDVRGDVSAQQADVARDLFMLGLCLYDQKRFADALEQLREALGLYARAFGGSPEDDAREQLPLRPEIARVLARLGPIHMKLQDWTSAVRVLRRAVAIFERCDAGSADHAECLGFLAYLLSKAPEFEDGEDEATGMRRRVLSMRVRLRGEEHPEVAMALRELASAEQDAQDFDAAARHLTRAMDIYRKIYGDDHEKTHVVERKLMSASAAASSARRRPSAPADQQQLAAAIAAEHEAEAAEEEEEEDRQAARTQRSAFLPAQISARVLVAPDAE